MDFSVLVLHAKGGEIIGPKQMDRSPLEFLSVLSLNLSFDPKPS